MSFLLTSTRTIKLFFAHSNSRDDEKLRVKLEPHLSSLQPLRVSINWHKSQTLAGKDWKQESYSHLNTSQVIVLLVSPDFLAAEDCRNITKRAMERHNAGKACIIPVKLRPIDNWQATPFSKLQCLPKNGEPVTSRFWARQDDAFVDIVGNIRAEVENLEKEQRQLQLIREQQKAAIFASINRFFSNQSFRRIIRDIKLPTRSVGIAASMIAVVAFVRFCSPSSETQVENFLAEGQNKFERGDYQEAFESYNKALEIEPKNIEAYIGRGNARSYLKDYKAAIQDYTRVISLSPESADAYMNRAVVRCTLGDKQGTIKDYQKAANLYAKQGATDQRKQALNRLKNLQQCGARSSN